jgi:hypothetical protein
LREAKSAIRAAAGVPSAPLRWRAVAAYPVLSSVVLVFVLIGTQAQVIAGLASAAAQAGDPDRARHLLALALIAESPEISSGIEGVSHFFPSAIRGAGAMFISAYKAGA